MSGNSADPTLMPHSVEYDLGLHCFLRPVCPSTEGTIILQQMFGACLTNFTTKIYSFSCQQFFAKKQWLYKIIYISDLLQLHFLHEPNCHTNNERTFLSLQLGSYNFSAALIVPIEPHHERRDLRGIILFVLRFYGPVNPMGSCRARSVYLTTRLLGRLSPLSG